VLEIEVDFAMISRVSSQSSKQFEMCKDQKKRQQLDASHIYKQSLPSPCSPQRERDNRRLRYQNSHLFRYEDHAHCHYVMFKTHHTAKYELSAIGIRGGDKVRSNSGTRLEVTSMW